MCEHGIATNSSSARGRQECFSGSVSYYDSRDGLEHHTRWLTICDADMDRQASGMG